MNAQKEGKREAECLKSANKALEEVETHRRSVAEVQGKKELEETQLQEVMDNLRESTKELRDKLEVSQAELADAERAVSGLSTEKETVAMAQKLIHSRLENTLKGIATAEEKLASAAADKKAAQETLVALEQEKAELEARRKEILSEGRDDGDAEATVQEKYYSFTIFNIDATD